MNEIKYVIKSLPTQISQTEEFQIIYVDTCEM